MITSDQVTAIDRNAAALGISQQQLMESSGNAVAQAVRDVTESGDSVVIVAGRGNNGGDAFAATRFLDDRSLTVLLLGRAKQIRSDIARNNWQALAAGDYDIREIRDSTAFVDGPAGDQLTEATAVVDAILGTGINGALREPAATAAEMINAASGTVLSVDVPSGVDPDTGDRATNAVIPDHIVTFHDRKPGLEAIDVPVTVADIGIPKAAELFVGPGDLQHLHREPTAHKGDHGEVLVVGGGPYSGAPALAAQAALRGGADLVRVACPASVASSVAGYSENLIVKPLPGDQIVPAHINQLQSWAKEHDSIVFGPGLGRDEASLEAATEFLSVADGRIVVDADPLRVIPEVTTDATVVCTPHRGELAAMGQETADDWQNRAVTVENFATTLGVTLLLKGRYDIITDGDQTRVNRTGNPGMTVGGTGDILAGLAGALLAVQPPVRASAIAAYTNGTAGDRLVDETGYGLVASDLPAAIAQVLRGETA